MRSDDLQSDSRLRWEKDCVRRATQGDQRAFGELYHEYAPRIFARVLMPRLGNRTAAEDALSETFRTGLERLHQFQPKGVSIYFWFSRIAMNKATDMHRVRGRTHRALTSFHELLTPLRPDGDDPHKAVESGQELAQLKSSIETVMSRLNPRYRRAIELRFLEDRSRQDCADALEVKLGTFDVLILRALRAFKREWEKTR
ncbi:MAG: RNA polymerase sigma factor [Myxococcota bacterium]